LKFEQLQDRHLQCCPDFHPSFMPFALRTRAALIGSFPEANVAQAGLSAVVRASW
jgi:hypothetical protein